MKALLRISAVILTSCTLLSANSSRDVCSSPDREAYTGVALALDSGIATFASDDPYCPYVLTGSEALLDDVFAQWRRSPYQGEIRPIYISVEGVIIPEQNKDLAPYFLVQTAHEVSLNFSDEQATRAFALRMGKPLPKPRISAGVNDPEVRGRLTD